MYRPDLAGLQPRLDPATLSPRAIQTVEGLRRSFIKAVLVAEAHGRAVDSQGKDAPDDKGGGLSHARLAPELYGDIFVDCLGEFARGLKILASCDGAEFAARSWGRAFQTAFPGLAEVMPKAPAGSEGCAAVPNSSSWSLESDIDDRAIRRLEVVLLGLLDSLPKAPPLDPAPA